MYEPNNNDLLNNQQFSVVTEIIRRSSNISLEPQHNSFNNGHLNYSFKENSFDNPMNQSFQMKTINIHIADSSSKKHGSIILNNSQSNEYIQNIYTKVCKI